MTVTHTYASAGSYTATLTVTDDKNAAGTATGVVNVSFSLGDRLNHHVFPKLANQVMDYAPTASFLQDCMYWDLLVLDAELVHNRPSDLGPFGTLRSANPNVVILSYFSAADIIPGNTATVNSGFIQQLLDGWYMKDTSGRRIKLFETSPGTWTEMLNLTTGVNAFMPNYLATAVLGGGLSDGVFYDWISDQVHWLNNRTPSPSGPLDIDNDSIAEPDAQLDSFWRQGTSTMLRNSRSAFPAGSLILGNGGWRCTNVYDAGLNGMMIEEFLSGESVGPEFGWSGVMLTYYQHTQGFAPNLSFIMANGAAGSSFQFQRFSLASALMFDGYFCFTNKGTYHSAWWYDEYAVDRGTGESAKSLSAKGYMGNPNGQAYNPLNPNELLKDALLAGGAAAQEKAWRRDFQYGIVLVNPGSSDQSITLGGTFRKIKGTVDPVFNGGGVISQITLPPRSGIVLLR